MDTHGVIQKALGGVGCALESIPYSLAHITAGRGCLLLGLLIRLLRLLLCLPGLLSRLGTGAGAALSFRDFSATVSTKHIFLLPQFISI